MHDGIRDSAYVPSAFVRVMVIDLALIFFTAPLRHAKTKCVIEIRYHVIRYETIKLFNEISNVIIFVEI